MKKVLSVLLVLTLVFGLAACGGGSKGFQVAVPNDTSNEARALLLLQEQGLIKLKDGAGITATKLDIAENPYNLEIVETEAAQIPNILKDVDYAVVNVNYALSGGLNVKDGFLAVENASSPYANIICVKAGNENDPRTKALCAACASQAVADFISKTYSGSVVSVVDKPTNGYDEGVDYAALKGTTISVAATPSPHCEILAIVKDILAAKDITLDIKEYTDYVQPNLVVESGEIFANFFQHVPYLDEFNGENGTHIVSVLGVHVEPMLVFGGKQTSFDALKK